MGKSKRYLIVALLFVCLTTPFYAKVNGFDEIKKEKYEEDILHTYRHEKSGLEVIWIENHDINKAFMIGVKTPTIDNTGVNHILEHTLFTGSEAYPSSSLFFDANEAYPSTYMNALTSGDMTIFPFSTPYMPSYEKLLSVYLDAVFKPNLLNEPYGFYEEGFHFVPEEERSGGVVYNEMKGAYGNMERTVYRSIRNTVYAESHYAFDSGGIPDEIPTLTYEAFIDTYYRYYYPGNMKMIVYGEIPIETTLESILSYVEEVEESKSEIDLSVSQLSESLMTTVEALPNTDKACISKSFVIDSNVSATELQELDLWMTAYLMSPQTFFQNQLLNKGIHVKWLKDDDLPYPVYTVVMTDVPCNKVKAYEQLLEQLLKEVPNHLSQNVFLEQDILKEAKWMWEKQDSSENRGINIGQSLLDSWAHGREMGQYYLKKEATMKMKALDASVSELLFTKARCYTLVLLPENKEFTSPETVSPVDAKTWQKIYKEMKVWQNQKVTLEPVELETLMTYPDTFPEIQKKPDYWEMELRCETSWIRSQLYLNTSHLEEDELPYLFLYSFLLEESARDISPFSGKIDTQCTAYPLKEGYWPCFKLSITTPAYEMEHGVLFNQARAYLLARPEEWYRQKLMEYTLYMRAAAQNNTLAVLSQLCLTEEGDRGAYLYQQSYPQYVFCQDLLEMKQNKWIKQVQTIDEKLYHKGGLILSTTVTDMNKNQVAESWKIQLESFPKIPNLKADYQFKIEESSCFVKSTSAIDYSFKSLNKEEGIDGMDYLYAAYLTKHYLNPQIRVKLGAYGAGCQVYDLETLGIYTYRDPDYRLSSDIVQGSAAFLNHPIDELALKCSKAEALSRVHKQFKLHGTPLEKSAMAEQLILYGKSPKSVINLQKEILDATPEALANRQVLYQKLLEKGKTAVMTKKDCSKEQNYKIYRY